jgi:hypothetical protein
MNISLNMKFAVECPQPYIKLLVKYKIKMELGCEKSNN